MLMEMMGLHLPGSAFVHPNTPLRDALVKAAAKRYLSTKQYYQAVMLPEAAADVRKADNPLPKKH